MGLILDRDGKPVRPVPPRNTIRYEGERPRPPMTIEQEISALSAAIRGRQIAWACCFFTQALWALSIAMRVL